MPKASDLHLGDESPFADESSAATVWAYYTTDGDAGWYGVTLFATEVQAREHHRKQHDAYGAVSALPIVPAPAPRPTSDPAADYATQRGMFTDQCDFLLDDDRWRFAWDTVASLKASVEGGMNPTVKMWQALKNIEDGGRRQAASEKNWKRRYEGR